LQEALPVADLLLLPPPKALLPGGQMAGNYLHSGYYEYRGFLLPSSPENVNMESHFNYAGKCLKESSLR